MIQKFWFIGKINKIDKTLGRLIRENTQISNIWNERDSTDSKTLTGKSYCGR